MHCTCGARNGHGPVYDEDGRQTDLWVCAKCRKPSRAFFARKCGMHVPKDAVAPLSEFGRADGIHQITFACRGGDKKVVLTYHPYPFGVGDMSKGRHYLLELWKKLDSEVAALKAAVGPMASVADYHKHRAAAFSEVIHMLMADFYPTRDDVVREALARWEHRNDSPNDHETPGLAEKYFDPLQRVAPVASAPVKTGRELSQDEIDAAKAGIAGGMFTVEQLADMFKTTPDMVAKHVA